MTLRGILAVVTLKYRVILVVDILCVEVSFVRSFVLGCVECNVGLDVHKLYGGCIHFV